MSNAGFHFFLGIFLNIRICLYRPLLKANFVGISFLLFKKIEFEYNLEYCCFISFLNNKVLEKAGVHHNLSFFTLFGKTRVYAGTQIFSTCFFM